jgi:hypothetical protein
MHITVLFEGTLLLHHFSKGKNQKEVTKQKKSRFSFLFLLNDRRIKEAQKHVDPDPDSDPDPQDCIKLKKADRRRVDWYS